MTATSGAVASTLLCGASVLLGGLVTWLVAWWYYRRAAQELRIEAGEIRHLNTVILGSLENAGLAKLTRDDSGRITGFTVSLSGVSRAPAPRATGNLTATPDDESRSE